MPANDNRLTDLTYYPGCSLESSAREGNISLTQAAKILGLNLIELEDWNCCGSSSANILDKEIAFSLAVRNLSLAPPDRPLMAMCPRCLYHLREAHQRLQQEPETLRAQKRRWGRPIPLNLEIIHFLEVLVRLGPARLKAGIVRDLGGLKFMPYYGCTVFRPPALRKGTYYQGELGHVLATLGGVPITQALTHRCCGSFLSAARADVVTPLVNEIIESAILAGAECIITSCAMCQLNLEIRYTWEPRIPIFHFSEILALALGAKDYEGWFIRHLVDPRPLLTARGLID
ncbi:MAG: heterodisulfide reductase-related iron-sulfur binding cluster [Syntrophobacterales bacterium]|jgi:heterodisulfide reductase subunit B|nr:heterodisulfide reductase-related iron-sulfur binding cluster [Syntrophobacterales bacterium]